MNAPTIIAFIIAAAVIVLLARGRSKKRAGAATLPTSGWHILYSPGMPSVPGSAVGGAWSLAFPSKPNHVDYVLNFSPPQLEYGKMLVALFEVTGGGFVAQERPDQPATVTLMLERRGDDQTAQGPMANYRQYSGAMVELSAGKFTLAVPLDEEHFGGVYGAHDKQAFQAVLADLAAVGLVFGSGSLRGHGVYATQPSTFTLRSLAVTDVASP